MMQDNRWRFPASNHGLSKGISTGDSETFKESPFKSFAREILQNSIDAKENEDNPVVVVFKEFYMKTQDIPGYYELKAQIKRCIEYWSSKQEYVKEYEKILSALENKEIKCLRVSDFNTTGCIGVESSSIEDNNFFALTKGSGVSEKSNNVAGGSKGIGKNASFLMSTIKTVFYSTHTLRKLTGEYCNNYGFMGVCDLISGYLDENKADYTQGTGFYSRDEFNNPLMICESLDNSYAERKNKSGTDIFIIGFNDFGDKERFKEAISRILDSFMVSIYNNQLIVYINDLAINKDNLKTIINDSNLFESKEQNEFNAQLDILNGGDKVKVYHIDTEWGDCVLYLLTYDKEHEHLATHKCSMVRYPYMKIKDQKLADTFPISGLCIIKNNDLGKMLRSIENPQHINWEPKRIQNIDERREIESVLKKIKEDIIANVRNALNIEDLDSIDPYGAGDFLPDISASIDGTSKIQDKIKGDNVYLSKLKENIFVDNNPREENEHGDSLQPDIGNIDTDEAGNVVHPSGENDITGVNRHPGEAESKEKDGDNVVFKRQKLSGVRFKVISLNKNKGILKIVFISPIDFDNCYLRLHLLDDVNNKKNVEILTLKCNGEDIKSDDKYEFGPFKIVRNKKIVLTISVNEKGYFGSEVSVICK